MSQNFFIKFPFHCIKKFVTKQSFDDPKRVHQRDIAVHSFYQVHQYSNNKRTNIRFSLHKLDTNEIEMLTIVENELQTNSARRGT